MRDATGQGSTPSRDDSDSIYALLAARARRAADGTLALCAAAGVAAVAVIGVARPRWWGLALPLLALGAFGAWGIADREDAARAGRAGPPGALHRTLRAAKWVAVVVGTGAAVLAALGFMAVALGKFIS